MRLQLPCCTCRGLFFPEDLRDTGLGDRDRPLFECVPCIRKSDPRWDGGSSHEDRNWYPSNEEAHR